MTATSAYRDEEAREVLVDLASDGATDTAEALRDFLMSTAEAGAIVASWARALAAAEAPDAANDAANTGSEVTT